MANIKYGRTPSKKKSFFGSLKSLDFNQLKEIKWKDLPRDQKRKILLGSVAALIFLMLFGLMSQNDEDMYKSTIDTFLKESALYDVNGVAKTTTSSAHQLVIGQAKKITSTKSRNYKTQIDGVDTKIISSKANSMIATAKVNSTEQIGQEAARKFTHLFIFQGQKVGASWKISNLLEAEAKLQGSEPKDNKKDNKKDDKKDNKKDDKKDNKTTNNANSGKNNGKDDKPNARDSRNNTRKDNAKDSKNSKDAKDNKPSSQSSRNSDRK